MTLCGQTNIIDLCGDCERNIRLIKVPLEKPRDVSIYNPKLMPTPSCDGYIKKEK